jgi:hypothetical protein
MNDKNLNNAESAGSVGLSDRYWLVKRLRVLANDSRKVYGLHAADCAAAMDEAAENIERLCLTDAERQALASMRRTIMYQPHADAIDGLLERTK